MFRECYGDTRTWNSNIHHAANQMHFFNWKSTYTLFQHGKYCLVDYSSTCTHQIITFQQVSAKQSIWQRLHPLRCYRKSTWFWHFFVIKPHFSPNRKILTAQCYARYLTKAWWSQQTYQHFSRQFIFRRVAFERRPIVLASRKPQYQRLA